ncbi:MAG: lytic transglycosylase domain-containing protein [Acidobacteriota bacterium]
MKKADRHFARMALLWLIALILVVLNEMPSKAQSRTSLDKAAKRVQRYEPLIVNAAGKYGVDPRMLWIIAWLETRFDPKQISQKGARGMMQFMPATAERYGLKNPHNPAEAIEAAASYVRDLSKRFDNRADLILAAYNSGEETVEAFRTGRIIKAGDRLINPKGIITGGIPPYRETQKYVAQGLQLLEMLSRASFLTSHQLPPTKNDEPMVDEGSVVSHSLVRKSVRADGQQWQSEIKPDKSGQVGIRRSLHFGSLDKQD